MDGGAAANEEDPETSETVDNIINITQSQDAALEYSYTTADGNAVTFSVFDVTERDAADIIGEDFYEQVN